VLRIISCDAGKNTLLKTTSNSHSSPGFL